MRCFIALEVPDRFAHETASLANQLAHVVEGRFMARDTYHLTAAFLGDISQQEVSEAISVLDAVCADAGSIPLVSDGLGKFGRSRDATLWLGVRPNDPMNALVTAIREGLSTRGIAFDAKAFKPHITLARRARLPQGDLPPLEFPQPADAVDVTLFKSELSAQGATYKVIHSVRLA